MSQLLPGARRWAHWLHELFEASLIFKGLMALAEAAAGLGLLLTANSQITGFVDWLTRNELAQDLRDWTARVSQHQHAPRRSLTPNPFRSAA